VTRRILETLPGAEGAVATALITGHQGAIPEATLAAMRDSGLAHLLSISGLHVGLVAATLMVGLRGLLALVPPLALRFPIKKWAAAAALAGTGAYTLLAGAPVPTQRAFVMSAIALLAIMLDRSPLSMRLVAWAAIAVLLAAPESLLSPSFQMSFAAVTALIAAHEGTARHRAAWRAEGGRIRRLASALLTLAATSLVAGLATAPFAIHHFSRLADYGVLANMAAVPITGFWVMPSAGLALALMPFGMESWPLAAMAAGIGLIVDIAEWVAALPGAALLVPAPPSSALATTALGGLWLLFWRGGWRWLGLVGPALAVALALVHRPPDLLIAGDGGVVAVRDATGRLMLSDPVKGGIAVDTWLRRAGQEERLPIEDELGYTACGPAVCMIEIAGRWVVVARDHRALTEHCASADLLIDLVPGRHRRCRGPRLVIDRSDLRREGTHALRIDAEGITIATVRRDRGERPWVAEAGSRRGRTPLSLSWSEMASEGE
jgi:competence protein ComEC